jgi:hypothetical protein
MDGLHFIGLLILEGNQTLYCIVGDFDSLARKISLTTPMDEKDLSFYH